MDHLQKYGKMNSYVPKKSHAQLEMLQFSVFDAMNLRCK